MTLVHPERDPNLRAPEFIVLPADMTRDDGHRIIAAATELTDLATELAKAGA